MKFRAIFALAVTCLAAPAFAQTPSAGATTAAGDPVVARVNGTELHRSDVLAALRSLPPQVQQQPMEKLYPAVLEQMVSQLLVSQAGKKVKLQDDPEVKRRVALARDQIVADVYVQRLVEKQVTDDKLHQRYDQLVKDTPPREEVKARHILVASEDEAKAIIAELNKGADFAKLAQEKSTDPAGKNSGGDLGYFTRDEMVPEFAETAFKLKPGEFTQAPVKTQFGWHVIKVEDRRPAKPPSFDQMKPRLQNDMARQIVTDRVKELKTAAKVEEYNLDGSKPGAAATPPAQPAAPNAPTLAPTAPSTAPQEAPTLAPDTKPKE